jgi:hypothetical protein
MWLNSKVPISLSTTVPQPPTFPSPAVKLPSAISRIPHLRATLVRTPIGGIPIQQLVDLVFKH